MEKLRKVKRSLIDSLLWVGLTSFIGFTQILLAYFIALLVDGVNFHLQDWVKNGAIVAFSLALVSSIFFDRHFQLKHSPLIEDGKSNKAFESLFYKLLPWIIVAVVVVSTLLSFLVDDDKINKEYLFNMQVASIILSYMYTLYYKFWTYYIGLNYAI